MTRRPRAQLTGRELEVVMLLAGGQAPKEISARLDISYWTVQGYIASARKRTDSRTNEQLVARMRTKIPRLADREPAPAI
jgi:DNA-binding CsgD family transcriptional regulator